MHYTNASVILNSLIPRPKMLSIKPDMAISRKIIVRIAKVRTALLLTGMTLTKSYYIVVCSCLDTLFNCSLTCTSSCVLLLYVQRTFSLAVSSFISI
jgi:hypothetical protein